MANQENNANFLSKALGALGSVGSFLGGVTDRAGGLLVDFGWSTVHFFAVNLMMRLGPAPVELFLKIVWFISKSGSSFLSVLLGSFLTPIWPNAKVAIATALESIFKYSMGAAVVGFVGYTLFGFMSQQYQNRDEALKQREGGILKNLIRYGRAANHQMSASADAQGNVSVQGIDAKAEELFRNSDVITQARAAMRYIAGDELSQEEKTNNLFFSASMLGPKVRKQDKKHQLLAYYRGLYDKANNKQDKQAVLDKFASYTANLMSAGTVIVPGVEQGQLSQNDIARFQSAYMNRVVFPKIAPSFAEKIDLAKEFIRTGDKAKFEELLKPADPSDENALVLNQTNHFISQVANHFRGRVAAGNENEMADNAAAEMQKQLSKNGRFITDLAKSEIISQRAFVLSRSTENWTHFAQVKLPTLTWVPIMLVATLGFYFGKQKFQALMGYRKLSDAKVMLGLILAGGASLVNFVSNLWDSYTSPRTKEAEDVEQWNGNKVVFADSPEQSDEHAAERSVEDRAYTPPPGGAPITPQANDHMNNTGQGAVDGSGSTPPTKPPTRRRRTRSLD